MTKQNSLDCEHEVDWDISITPPSPDAKDQRWMRPGDMDDMVRWKAACIHVYCRKCGCKGVMVDDTGNFWSE